MKAGTKVGYKVVRVFEHNALMCISNFDRISGRPELRSCNSVVSRSANSLRYIVGRWTRRDEGHGPMALFTKLKDAKRMLRQCGNLLWIYRCEYVPSTETKLWYRDIPSPAVETLQTLGLEYARSMFPGTVLADAIKLTERVQ